jgi:hypothetical protein
MSTLFMDYVRDGKPNGLTFRQYLGAVFEGCQQAERHTRYPLCVEGERPCPPEDVDGTRGYREFLRAIADPGHERHEEYVRWLGRRFDPRPVRRRRRDEENAAGIARLAALGMSK